MKKASATQNYIYNTLYKVLTFITPLITAPYLARVIGRDAVGIFSYTYAIAYNFTLLAKLGLISYGSRAVARVRDDKTLLSKTFSEIYLMQLLTTAFASIVYFVYALAFATDYKTIILVNGLYVLGIAFDIDWLFYGLENFKMTSMRNAVVKVLTVFAILLFVKTKEDLLIYVIIMVASDMIRFLSIWIHFHKCTYFSKIKFSDCLRRFKPNLLLFVPVIATSIYRSMDKIMLGAMSTMSETGLYENSEKIVFMLLGFITSLESVMMPRISNLLETGRKKDALASIDKSFTFVIFLTSAMAFGVCGITERFVPLFYGSEFLGVISLLPWLAVTLIFIGWANVIRTQYVIPVGKDTLYLWSTVIGAVSNLIINYLLIPKLGAFGAVIGTIVAELSVACFLSAVVRKQLPIFTYLKKNCAFIAFGVVMAVITHFCGKIFASSYISLLFQVFVGAAFYLTASLFYLKRFNAELYAQLSYRIKRLYHRFVKKA